MGTKGKPKVTKIKVNENSKKDWTKITFKPDLKRFAGMTILNADIVALMTKRVHDIAATNAGLKVTLNGEKLKIKNFLDYSKLFLERPGATAPGMPPLPLLHQKFGDRWEVVVSISDGQFQQNSFVNSIATTTGGTHVNHVADQIVKELVTHVKKKNKTTLKPFQVKNHLWVFVNSLIENPAFDSQTKNTMTSKPSTFGSKCDIDEKFIKKVIKCGVVDSIMAWAKMKESAQMKRQDGGKKANVVIPKLDDANWAGGRKGKECTLILTEGDSAKALAVSGLGVVGRDKYGVFPLRGKLLNVREASHKQVMDNAEITAIKKILGLQTGKVYEDTSSLRYGHVMIMADQDHDGSHIKGLLINFIHSFWPSLLKVPGFLIEFITPIVKVTKGQTSKSFFTLPEYETWKNENNDGKGWNIKYYKGLGTSTSKEAKEYFSAMDLHRKSFRYDGAEDDQLIDMAFSKKKVEERKVWLNAFQEGTFLDHTAEQVSYSDFVNKELILFSMADNIRSIPSLLDGFKPSQRKVLFSCFKRKLKKDIKVVQLAGYVSEHSAYHHGEASLQGTIINMAQNYCGSNNINLLVPSGQFGTRLLGGKDAASPRYIFTRLQSITRAIFHESDDALMDFLDDDGLSIEPKFYMPVVPLLLVNGTDGIGTGWSTMVPSYNPRDIVKNLKHLLAGEEMEAMIPWYRGFNGTIEVDGNSNQKFNVRGKIEKVDETTLEISELPINSWTNTYTDFLIGMMTTDKAGDFKIESYVNHSSDTRVSFTIKLSAAMMAEAEKKGLEKTFKIATTISCSNMHVYSPEGHIVKYDQPTDIIQAFYGVRLDYYAKRKALLLKNCKHELTKLDNKSRFILAVVNGEFIVNNRKKAEILAALAEAGYDEVFDTKKPGKSVEGDDDENDDEESSTKSTSTCGYDYLLKMPLWNLTKEKVDKLCAEREEKQAEYDNLDATSPADLWNTDLDALLEELDRQDEWDENQKQAIAQIKAPKAAAKKPKKKAKTFKVSMDSDDDDMGDDSGSDFEVSKPKKKAAPKKQAAPKKAAAPAPAPVEAPAPEPIVVEDVQSEDSDDELGPSLAERMAARGLASTIQPAATSAATAINVEDEIVEGIETMSIKKKPAESRKRTKAKVPAATPDDTPQKPDQKKRKPAAKKAATKKAAPKKKVESESEEEFDLAAASEDEVEAAPAPARAGGRARAKVDYSKFADDSEDEESEADDDDNESDFE